MRSLLPITVLVAGLSVASVSRSEAVDYQEEIRPILNSKCYKCHSGPRAKGKLRMDSKEHFSDRIGGDDPAIIPGDSSRSLLIIKATLPRDDGEAMPPPPARARGAEPMTSVEINLVKRWIDLGAKLEPGETTEPAPAPEGGPSMTNEMHDWTNTQGQTIQAAFVRVEGVNIVIKMPNGQEIPYAIAKLSPESKALAKKLAGL
ncbi:MAG: c-type cytochrome domain-containing protein [Verrucomicrobiota bacterium]